MAKVVHTSSRNLALYCYQVPLSRSMLTAKVTKLNHVKEVGTYLDSHLKKMYYSMSDSENQIDLYYYIASSFGVQL